MAEPNRTVETERVEALEDAASGALAGLPSRPARRLVVDVSDEDVVRFRRQGYLRVERLSTDEELEWLGTFYDRLFEARVAGVRGGYLDLTRPYDSEGPDHLPQVLLPEIRFPVLLETDFARNARRIGARLIGAGETVVRLACHLIAKPPRVGAETPWHQDEAYWDPRHDHSAVSAWMPLEDADVESGCMCFVPGSHHRGVRRHEHIGGDPRVHGLVTSDVPTSDAIACPVRAGAATFHHHRLLHYAGPNRSDRRRRACIAVAQTEPVPRQTPYDRPWFHDGQAAWSQRTLRAEPR